jgi:HEAT repeat protein
MMRATFVAILVLGGLLCSPSVRADEMPEPRYNGKNLNYWVAALINAEKNSDRDDAAAAIKSFGPDAAPAIPALMVMLDDRSEDFRRRVAGLLSDLGPTAKAAVPALVDSLKRKTARDPELNIQILGSIGPDSKAAVPVLINALDDPKLTESSVEALGKIGPSSKDAVPLLTKLLTHKNNVLASRAARALWSIDSDPTGVPVLARYLGDFAKANRRGGLPAAIEGNENEAMRAAETLGRMGPKAKSALPALRAASDTICGELDKVAEKAIRAIEMTDPADKNRDE